LARRQQTNSAVKFLLAMYKSFIDLGCLIVEINPWRDRGAMLSRLDAKMISDDNALYRHLTWRRCR